MTLGADYNKTVRGNGHAYGVSATDEQLVEACKKDDDLAFRELMTRYAGSIRGFALQYVKNEEDAEDIAQEAFFKAWKHMDHFEKGGRFRPWIYAIARNTALDHIKKKKAFVFSDLDDEENDIMFADTLQDPEPLPDELFERSGLAKELEDAMRTLHPDHGAIMVMYYHGGMTFDEIARVIKKPMNTVKSWHRRTLIKLRKELMHRHGR